MKLLVLSFLASVPALLSADLVAWFPLNGSTKDVVKGTVGQLKGDARMGRIDQRNGADFAGINGVLCVSDSPQVVLGPSFSVSAQVWVRDNPRNGTTPAGQIVFRGDDRSALDNYSLCLGSDGFFTFRFDAPDGTITELRAPSRTNAWVTLLGTLDAKTRHMTLQVDGFLVAEQWTPLTPVTAMDQSSSPGFSIGNVQNPFGGQHNQPFNGVIRDVKIFNTAVTWDELNRNSEPGGSNDRNKSVLADFFN